MKNRVPKKDIKGWITVNGKHIPITSHFIQKVNYDEDLKEMVVGFRNKTKTRYHNVSDKEFDAVTRPRSGSIGKEFWKYIRRSKIYSKE